MIICGYDINKEISTRKCPFCNTIINNLLKVYQKEYHNVISIVNGRIKSTPIKQECNITSVKFSYLCPNCKNHLFFKEEIKKVKEFLLLPEEN